MLEVGCGLGFFTIPAARIVGETGRVYAIDLHPLAIEMVRKKLARTGLTNVEVMLADAADTGLPDESVDLAFLFGVVHVLPLGRVLPEMHRVLRPGGILAVDAFPGWSPEPVTGGGLFALVGKEGRVFRFVKE